MLVLMTSTVLLETKSDTVPTSTTTHPTFAAQACFNTTELLEMIMGFLDVKTLLLSQRVSPQFKAVIEGSQLLQPKLFFAPATLDQVLATGDVEKICACRDYPSSPRQPQSALNGILDVSAAINPAFFNKFRPPKGLPAGAVCDLAATQTWFQRHVTPWRLPFDQSSCSRMYMAHPMPGRLRVSINRGEIDLWLRGYDADGPRTFGRLVEVVERDLKKKHVLRLLASGGVTSVDVVVPGECFRLDDLRYLAYPTLWRYIT